MIAIHSHFAHAPDHNWTKTRTFLFALAKSNLCNLQRLANISKRGNGSSAAIQRCPYRDHVRVRLVIALGRQQIRRLEVNLANTIVTPSFWRIRAGEFPLRGRLSHCTIASENSTKSLETMLEELVASLKLHPQRFLNGEVHDWYRIVLGYSDHLVGGLLDEFDFGEDARILDPFCGSGTTLVEAMKRGMTATGIDANPSSCFAAQVKTNWAINPDTLRALLDPLRHEYRQEFSRGEHESDPFYQYLLEKKYLGRWLSSRPAQKIIALKRAIKKHRAPVEYKNVLMLALVAQTVVASSNVKFGPELYCSKARKDSSVFSGFESRVRKICDDLVLVTGTRYGKATVIWGDARTCGKYLKKKGQFSAIISSPPYPTEHDYTRNSRLELALLGLVSDRESLRKIKFEMIRSHTKGIYSTDSDARLVDDQKAIENLAVKIDCRAKNKTYGFARLYSTVLREYFGGLKRHFRTVFPLVTPGGICAYVVGDQSSYLQVHIPTAKLLKSLAIECGFEHIETRRWRTRWSTSSGRSVAENILILRVPELRKRG